LYNEKWINPQDTILSVNAPNNRATKYVKQKLLKMKEEIDHPNYTFFSQQWIEQIVRKSLGWAPAFLLAQIAVIKGSTHIHYILCAHSLEWSYHS